MNFLAIPDMTLFYDVILIFFFSSSKNLISRYRYISLIHLQQEQATAIIARCNKKFEWQIGYHTHSYRNLREKNSNDYDMQNTIREVIGNQTPFSFIDYLLHKFNDGSSPTKLSISGSMELILSIIRGTDFLAFRPWEIAAAVALSVLGETQTVDVDKGVSSCIHTAKERVLRCYEAIQEIILMRNCPLKNASPSVSSVPQSPIAVLDAAC